METKSGLSPSLAILKTRHPSTALKVCDTEDVLANLEQDQNLGYGT